MPFLRSFRRADEPTGIAEWSSSIQPTGAVAKIPLPARPAPYQSIPLNEIFGVELEGGREERHNQGGGEGADGTPDGVREEDPGDDTNTSRHGEADRASDVSGGPAWDDALVDGVDACAVGDDGRRMTRPKRNRSPQAGGPRQPRPKRSGRARSGRENVVVLESLGKYYDDVLVSLEYDKPALAAIRALPDWSRYWDPEFHVWRINPGYAARLAAALRRLGYTVWWATKDPQPGAALSWSKSDPAQLTRPTGRNRMV